MKSEYGESIMVLFYGKGVKKLHIIRPNAVGWGVYDKPYYWLGERIESLYFTAKTKEECEDYCKEHGMEYEIKED